jgi:signal transduction histidine kinase
MSTAFTGRRVSRAVALRLAAGVLPSVLAVGLLIGLFYYGQFGRAIPALILVLASALTIASIVMAWVNAMYFAERLARLARFTARASDSGEPTDEFDRIEQAVGNLGSALTASEAERARLGAIAEARLHEQATMLAGAVSDSISQLDQVRLPLQILLESPFGELNDNQEELLRDARAASDAIDVALRRLAQVADIDRDAFPVQHELVQVNDVVRSVLPLARAAAERNGARTETALEPGLPRVVGDRTRLAEALSLLVTAAAAQSDQAKPLVVTTAREGSRAIVRIAPRAWTANGDAPAAAGAEALPAVASGPPPAQAATFVLAS